MVSLNSLYVLIIAGLQLAYPVSPVPFNFDSDNDIDDSKMSLSPVILVPGLEGSRLEALLQTDFSCHRRTNDYIHVWLSEEYMLPFSIDCLLSILTIHPPSEQRVLVRVPGFGDTRTIENLNPFSLFAIDSSEYMKNLVRSLVDHGYVRNVSVRGAPYDFRLSPYELKDEYYEKMDGLIYETFLQNNERKPVLVCHSLGCLLMLAYLNTKSQAWKDRYIERLITVAAPFGGSMKALKAITIGDNMGLSVYRKDEFMDAERTFPSLTFLLPNPKVFGDQVLIKTPEREYRATDYPAIFNKFNITQVYKNWNMSKDIIPDIPFPGVDVTCIYSVGKKTPEILHFGDGKVLTSAKVEHGIGDGTVNLKSLQYCHNWLNLAPRFDVQIQAFKGIGHFDLIKHKNSVKYITKILTS